MTPTQRGPGAFDPAVAAQQILQGPIQQALMIPGVPAQAVAPAPVHQIATPEGLLPDSLSDRGNAKLFVRLYGRDYRHVPGLGWYRWSGHRWQLDEEETVLWAVGEMAEAIATLDPTGTYATAELRRHRRRALSTSGMNALLMQAKASPGMVMNAALLDADPYALCTPEGVVDLRSGALLPPIRPPSTIPGPPPSHRTPCPPPLAAFSRRHVRHRR